MILTVLAFAAVLIISTRENNISSAAENDVDTQLISKETYNAQEPVYEDSNKDITYNKSELMIRTDISIKEIHDLKGASREVIHQKLGEPHGSVSGGSFQQSHYILENGDIVIFSTSEFDNTPKQFSVYDKNGELKNTILCQDKKIVEIYKKAGIEINNKQINSLTKLYDEKNVNPDYERLMYEEGIITGEVDPTTPKLDLSTAKDIIKRYTDFESIIAEFEKVQNHPDIVGGSGVTHIIYKYNQYDEIVVLYEQEEIIHHVLDSEGNITSSEKLF